MEGTSLLKKDGDEKKSSGGSCKAILHLLVAEALPFYIFYASFLDVMTSLEVYLYLWSMEETSHRPGQLQYCVTNDFWTAVFIPLSKYKGECIDLSDNHIGYFNLGCVLICVFGILFTAWVVLKEGGSDVHSGQFFKALWKAQFRPVYKGIAIVMAIYLLIAFLYAFWKAGILNLTVEWHRTAIMDFLFYKVISVTVLILNAVNLTAQIIPEFEYDSAEFESLQFKRTWTDVLFQSLSVFTNKLQSAILHAHADTKGPLRELLQNPDDVDNVLKVCKIKKDEGGRHGVGARIMEDFGT